LTSVYCAGNYRRSFRFFRAPNHEIAFRDQFIEAVESKFTQILLESCLALKLDSMAKVEYDSELMTQQIAAVPIPPTKRFVALSDHEGSPIIISVGNNGTLYAIKEDISNSRALVDLSAAFGISGHKIVAFDCRFNEKNSMVYLCFAYDAGEDTKLVVLKPFQPIALDDVTTLKDLMIPFTGRMKTNISRIFMVSLDFQTETREKISHHPNLGFPLLYHER